jgi:hypothetical protein
LANKYIYHWIIIWNSNSKSKWHFHSIIGHIFFNSLTTIFAVVNYNMNNNIVKLSNGEFYFNNVINIISLAIFIATFFIIFKMPLDKVNSNYLQQIIFYYK